MRATVIHGAGDVRIENVPDAALVNPTDAVVRVTRACICGSDLWPYQKMAHSDAGQRIGHEAIGVVEAIGRDVRSLKVGDFVVMPFAFSDGTCTFCHEHLYTSCVHGGFFGTGEVAGAQAEAVRVPYADGTLYALKARADEALMPSLLTLSDVMGTGHHAARMAQVGPGKTVAVVGDGAVGLCGVIAAKRLGADRIILLGRHADRIALAREFARPTLSASAATQPSNACANSPEVLARIRCSSASVTASQPKPPFSSLARVARLAALVYRRKRPYPPRNRRFFTTSLSAVDPPRCVPTSRNCCRTFWKAASIRVACSTVLRASTGCRTVIAP